jgi:hypothetical protein
MNKALLTILSLSLLASLMWIGVAEGQAGSSIPWRVFSGGGAPAGAGNISLNGSLGQTAIGRFSTPADTLGAGYWYARYGGLILRRISLPIVQQRVPHGPDLVVEDLQAASNGVTVRIKNIGDQPVQDDFWVDVYFDPRVKPPHLNQPWPDIAPFGVVWGVLAEAKNIPSGGVLDLASNTSDPYYSTQYSAPGPFPGGADVYAYVDSINFATTYGAVRETDEGNNVRRQFPSLSRPARNVVVSSDVNPGRSLGKLPSRP